MVCAENPTDLRARPALQMASGVTESCEIILTNWANGIMSVIYYNIKQQLLSLKTHVRIAWKTS